MCVHFCQQFSTLSVNNRERQRLAAGMRVSDRPGRYIAAFVVCPLLATSAYFVYDSPQPVVSAGLYAFSAILFIYELFWITRNRDEVWYNGGDPERLAKCETITHVSFRRS